MINALIPFNLDIDSLLKRQPPPFEHDRDDFTYFLHLITKMKATYRDKSKVKSLFVKINANFLQRSIPKYNLVIDYLHRNGVIDVDRQYRNGEYSRGYRFAKKYRTEVFLEKTVNEILLRQYGKPIIKEVFYYEKYNYLKKWFNPSLQFNYEGAYDWLLKNAVLENGEPNIELINNSKYAMEYLKSGKHLFSIGENNHRLTTSITLMKKELRAFLRYDGKKLAIVDLKNSQPTLSCLLLTNFFKKNRTKFQRLDTFNHLFTGESNITFPFLSPAKSHPTPKMIFGAEQKLFQDEMKFVELCASGQIFTHLNSLFNERLGLDINRSGTKDAFFGIIYGRNETKRDTKDVFEMEFPNVYRAYYDLKRKNHTYLSILLQKIEAMLILDFVCKCLSRKFPAMPIYTIHDAIVCPMQNTEEVTKIIQEETMKVIGITPQVDVKILDDKLLS